MTELPTDLLLFHILPRLPAKTLLRFMCVCKPWHSFLTTTMFAKMHLHHATNDRHQNHHKLLGFSTKAPYKFRSMDCEAPEDGLTTVSRSLPFQVGSVKNMRFLASLNGLVCIGIVKSMFDDEFFDLILWNPLIGDYKTLSKPNYKYQCGGAFGLCYSSSDDDYKLLHINIYCNVYIYSLKFDSWRKVDSTQDSDFQHIRRINTEQLILCGLLNEKLYFLTQVKRGITSRRSYSIIRFDMKTEKGTEIKTPFINLPTACLSLTAVTGYTDFCVTYPDNRIELWRMDGDADWTKVITYHRSLCDGGQPLHLMRNGNWVMHYIGDGCVYKVDLGKHTKDKCSYEAITWVIPPTGKYMETFVSPNQYHPNPNNSNQMIYKHSPSSSSALNPNQCVDAYGGDMELKDASGGVKDENGCAKKEAMKAKDVHEIDAGNCIEEGSDCYSSPYVIAICPSKEG